MIANVLQVGDPGLRKICDPVEAISDPAFVADNQKLHQALVAFRAEHGFGRAIAAPQLGIPRRLIAMNLDGNPFSVINPEITHRSKEQVTLWDDCMSFPWLLVRVQRTANISVRFQDAGGEMHHWEHISTSQSELFQHEMDHLDGVLALDRALDKEAIVSREVFEKDPDYFKSLVSFSGVY